MDKQFELNGSKQAAKRPRWLTLCMMATAASVIVLSGCGDNEEAAPPAEEPSPLEQDTVNGEEPAMEQEPGLEEDPGSDGSMNQSTGPEAEAPMSEDNMSEENMPEDTMDEPATGTMNPDEDEAGFGEGTDPMPGESSDTAPNAEEDDEVTSNQ